MPTREGPSFNFCKTALCEFLGVKKYLSSLKVFVRTINNNNMYKFRPRTLKVSLAWALFTRNISKEGGNRYVLKQDFNNPTCQYSELNDNVKALRLVCEKQRQIDDIN